MKAVLRFLITTTIGVAGFATITPAADMLDVSGHARTRFEYKKNLGAGLSATAQDEEAFYNRVRLNLDVAPAKALKVRIAPQFTHTWGTASTTLDQDFTAHEAYFSWQVNDMWTLKVGRQEIDLGSGLIIGASQWGNGDVNAASNEGGVSQGLDAVVGVVNYDKGSTVLWWNKVADETFGAGADEGDIDNLGMYTTLKPNMAMVDTFDIYALYWLDRVPASKSKFVLVGTRLVGDAGMFDYSAELAAEMGYNSGNTDMFKGVMGDLNVGTALMDKHHVGLNVAYANTEWANIVPNTHADLGTSDVITRTNLLSFGLLTDWNVSDKVGAGFDAYYFLAAKDDAATAGGLAGTGTDRPLGMELDLSLNYAAMDNFNVETGYAMFKPLGRLEKAPTNNKVAHDLYVQGTVNF